MTFTGRSRKIWLLCMLNKRDNHIIIYKAAFNYTSFFITLNKRDNHIITCRAAFNYGGLFITNCSRHMTEMYCQMEASLHKQLEMHGCVISTVSIDVLVLKHRASNNHIYCKQHEKLFFKIILKKKIYLIPRWTGRAMGIYREYFVENVIPALHCIHINYARCYDTELCIIRKKHKFDIYRPQSQNMTIVHV